MAFVLTPEQQAVVEFATQSQDNLIISALAGAAKTSTLVEVAKVLRPTRLLCLAFNKKIATEMTERLPENCVAMTLNSLGHRTWASALGKRIILEKDKNYQILTTLIKDLSKREQEQAYDEFAETLRIVDFGKACGYIPTGHHPRGKRLMDDNEFFNHLEDEPSALQEKLVREASVISINKAFDGLVDFGDQIMMPTLFPALFDSYPVVMVDEAQDLSALNHATLRKLARKRLIAVGDPNQAIYGFRGAHEESMALLQESFKMTPRILSISFRCPIAVVKEAQWRAPHMQWPEWAKEGAVLTLPEWDASSVPESAAIICRNNAPLFNMAIKLLKNGRRPQIIGNDIGKALIKVMRKLGKMSMDRVEVEIAIDQWCEDKMKKSRNKGKIIDQAQCMKIFAAQGENLGDAVAYAEHLFNSQGPIMLMTVHKSKGLEFDTVFILDRKLINIEEGQESNILYVAQTRAKKELIYVTSDSFVDEAGD
jgi:superfamily I DNA/RNA helicase